MTSGTRPALSARAVFRKQETLPGKRQNNTGAESVESLPGRGASTTERRCFQRRANAATDETPAVERKLVCACRTGHPPLPCRRYSRRRSASGMFRPPPRRARGHEEGFPAAWRPPARAARFTFLPPPSSFLFPSPLSSLPRLFSPASPSRFTTEPPSSEHPRLPRLPCNAFSHPPRRTLRGVPARRTPSKIQNSLRRGSRFRLVFFLFDIFRDMGISWNIIGLKDRSPISQGGNER